MSLCLHHFLRSRLHGLSFAQRRSPACSHRGSGIPRTGYGVYHESTYVPPVTEESESYLVDHYLSSDAYRYQTNRSSPARTLSKRVRTKDAKTSKDRYFVSPRKSFLSNVHARKLLIAQGLKGKHANYLARRVNKEILQVKRPVHPILLNRATLNRVQSLYPRQGQLHQWQAAYAEVYKAKHYQRRVDPQARVPQLRGPGIVLLQLIRADCQRHFRKAWRELRRPAKASEWQRLALWLIQNEPALALEFLFVTRNSEEKPDFTMVADCLLYLDKFHYDELKDWRSGRLSYQLVIWSCLSHYNWPVFFLPQKAVRLYIRRVDHKAVALAFTKIKARSMMTAETALCFMYRFTELGDVDQALEALRHIPKLKDPEFKMDSQGVMRHCCKLLTLDSVQDGPDGTRNFRILPQLLGMGVRPDRDMMNVVLSNAFKTGDPELGAGMLRFMKAQDMEFDSYTYLTLLCDAVARGDRGHVDSVVQDAKSGGDHILMNPYVANKIFHAHFVFTAKHLDGDGDAPAVFYSMLDMYNQLHDITPLRDLLIIPPRYTPPDQGAKPPPNQIALYIMIATYLRCQKHHSNAHRVYSRFCELVKNGHESIAPLAETDHVYNEFLVAFRRDPRGLRASVKLVENMLLSHSMGVEGTSSGTTIIHCKPSVRTWTILLSAFIYHNKPAAAESVREMMAKYNIEYNNVTWNTIISGYASTQNIPETAAAIKMMEEQGFPIDPYTMKSLRYLRGPERLWVAIDELDKRVTEQEPQSGIYNDVKGRDELNKKSTEELQSEVQNDVKGHDELIERRLEQLSSILKPKL